MKSYMQNLAFWCLAQSMPSIFPSEVIGEKSSGTISQKNRKEETKYAPSSAEDMNC